MGFPRPARSGLILASLLVCIASATVPSQTSGQERRTVSGAVTCSECRIVFDTVAIVGGLDEGSEVLSILIVVAVDPQGRVLITNWQHQEIFVFSETGRFLRTVGRAGDGPGEFRDISGISTGPRYVHVSEFDRGRTLLDHAFGFVRRDQFPGQFADFYVTNADDAVLTGNLPSPSSVGHPLHIVSPDGAIRSFGADPDAAHQGHVPAAIATGNEELLWVMNYGSASISRWELAPTPRLVETWDREFDEWDRHPRGEDVDPKPITADMFLGGEGLWIAWNAPDPERPPGRPRDLRPTTPENDMRDGWIDLVNPATGETIARHREDDLFLGFAGSSRYLATYRETAEGIPYLHILNPRLVREPSREVEIMGAGIPPREDISRSVRRHHPGRLLSDRSRSYIEQAWGQTHGPASARTNLGEPGGGRVPWGRQNDEERKRGARQQAWTEKRNRQ